MLAEEYAERLGVELQVVPVSHETKVPILATRLDQIVTRMEDAARRRSWLDINEADLGFHREICLTSGNSIVITLWQALARHVLIVFGQEIRSEKDADVMGPPHRRIRDLLAEGDVDTLDAEIEKHILRLRHLHGAVPPGSSGSQS